jgi:hypothetical protein
VFEVLEYGKGIDDGAVFALTIEPGYQPDATGIPF